MQLISLFSGIGGFELAAEWMGWDVVASCEINPFGRRVLKHYWPDAYHHDDIHTLNYETLKTHSRWDPTRPTILTGGFPCQPYSMAGKRRGKEDDRHLWPEMCRIIREVRPDYIVGENVLGLVSWDGGLVFDEVHSDLEAEGYEVQAVVIPAAAVNAPHGRDRVWFVANYIGQGLQRGKFSEDGCTDGKWFFGDRPTGGNIRGENTDISDERPTTHTESKPSERLRSEQREFSDTQKREFGGNGGGMGYGVTTHPEGQQDFRRGQSGFQPITSGADDKRPTTDTDIAPTEHTIQTGRDLPTSCDGEGAAANTHSLRLEQRTDGTEMGGRQKKMGRQGSESANAAQTNGKVSDVTNTESNGQQRSDCEHEKHTSEGGEYAQRDIEQIVATDCYNKGLQGCKVNGSTTGSRQNGNKQPTRFFRTDWSEFPTQSPIRNVNDGIPGIMVRNIKKEIYATISERYTNKDLQEVWDALQSEEIRDKIGRLYKIHEPGLLLQTLQLCASPSSYEIGSSVFSEEASKDLMRKLQNHKTFANTPHGRELEKQFAEQFGNALPYLSHEIALVTMEAERASRKFSSWHRNESIKAAGNAIVPQVAYSIFRCIQSVHH